MAIGGIQSYTGPTIIQSGTLTLAAAPTVPLSTGLQYQLDASNPANLVVSGSAVASWNDSSGHGVNFVQGDTSLQPTYDPTALNGRGAVVFNGTSNKLVGSVATPTQTVFIVNQVTGFANNLDGIFGQDQGDFGIRLIAANAWSNPGNGNDFSNGGAMVINGVVQSGNGTFTAGEPHILEAVSASSSDIMAGLGEYFNNNVNALRWYQGDIGEVLVYDGVLSDFDNQAVTQYLAAKWLGIGSTGNDLLPTGTAVSITGSGATFDLGNISQTIGSLAGVEGSNVNLENNILTTGGDNTSTTFAGVITGSGSLVKVGSGVFTLAGVNLHSGGTMIAGGTLRVANTTGSATGTGPVAVGDGTHAAILAGSTAAGQGFISGPVTVNNAATIAAASGATLTLGDTLTLSGGSMSSFALTTAGVGNAGNPLVSVAGMLIGPTDGTHTVNFTGTAAQGTYDLFNYADSSVSLGQFTIGTHPAGDFSYALLVSGTEIDLSVSPPALNAQWNVNGGGSFNLNTNWNPQNVPNGVGIIAAFGNGATNNVTVTPSLTVTIDAPVTVGGMNFGNSNGTGYIIGGADAITLDNGGAGATISVTANTPQKIYANITLADDATFDIATNSSLLMTVGSIGESGSHSLTKTGGGELTLDLPNSYSGGTIVANGTLTVTGTGSIGVGSLEVDGAAGNAAIINLQNSQAVTGLTGTVAGGSARVNVTAGKTLTLDQAAGSQTFAGVLALGGVGTTNGGAVFTKSGSGTEILTAAPQWGDNTALNVTEGTLRVDAGTGTPTVGAHVVANVTGTATLELAGPVSALGTSVAGQRVAINNSSTAAAGVLVSGGDQQVGGINGTGNVEITPPENGTASLTADHIKATALVIGGDATSSALVTIAVSDALGNPTTTSGFALAGSLAPAASSTDSGASSLLAANDAASDSRAMLGGTAGSSNNAAGNAAAVPEPPTLLLTILALISLGAISRRSRPFSTTASGR